jgi:NADPH:quinone reductase-like Zn-dependent oxidoreductase
VTVIQSGAGSAVGRIVTALLNERGVRTIRLVRSVASARRLKQQSGADPVIATDSTDWLARLAQATAGKEIHVAVDGVGGIVLPRLAEVLHSGGTIISYGALGGASTDIRLVVPRGLNIKGVSIAQWGALPAKVRKADVQTAMRLASARPDLFQVEAVYTPHRLRDAVDHLHRPGRSGAVLLDFSGESI